MDWKYLGPLIVVAMIAVAVVAKTNDDMKLFWFGALMAISFSVSVVIHHAKST